MRLGGVNQGVSDRGLLVSAIKLCYSSGPRSLEDMVSKVFHSVLFGKGSLMEPNARYCAGLVLLLCGCAFGVLIASELTLSMFVGAAVGFVGILGMVAVRAELERALLGRRVSSDRQLCWGFGRVPLAAVLIPSLMTAILSSDARTSAYFYGVTAGALAIVLLLSNDPPDLPRKKKRRQPSGELWWRFGWLPSRLGV